MVTAGGATMLPGAATASAASAGTEAHMGGMEQVKPGTHGTLGAMANRETDTGAATEGMAEEQAGDPVTMKATEEAADMITGTG
eukprot:gene7299-7512_t